MLDVLIIVDVALQRAVGGNPLTKEDGVHDGLQVLARDEERTAAIQNGDAGGAVVAVDHQLDLREVLGIPVESESYLFAKSSADTLGAAGGAQSLQLLEYVREVCLLAVEAEGIVVEGRAFLVRLFRQLHVHAVGLAAELDVKARGLVPVEQDDVLGQQRGGVGVEQTVADAGVYEVYHLRARDARIAAAVRGVGAELKVEGLFLLARFVDRLAVLVRLVGLYLSRLDVADADGNGGSVEPVVSEVLDVGVIVHALAPGQARDEGYEVFGKLIVQRRVLPVREGKPGVAVGVGEAAVLEVFYVQRAGGGFDGKAYKVRHVRYSLF